MIDDYVLYLMSDDHRIDNRRFVIGSIFTGFIKVKIMVK